MIILFEPYRILRKGRILIENILYIFPVFRIFILTRKDEYPITLIHWFIQKVVGINGSVYWPVHPSSLVYYNHRVLIGKGVYPGYTPGCFIHGYNGIEIGDYTYIAPNVGIMSSNHVLTNLQEHTLGKPIKIGNYCWLSMNCMILPEVELGDFTIVGAGSIVTKSFTQGYCVIAGNPARVIKEINKNECIRYEKKVSYIGFIPISKFETFKHKYIESK
jgi:acetyltransferase-like isoleucine patch superfamily enzyme